MGAVYRAIDENLGVEIALKENFFTSDEYARQFRREASILASLRHPNLPRVTDHFVIEGQGQYLVMDYIEGEDLRERIDRTGILPEEEVAVLGVAICEALHYLHTRIPTVLHRDIKPGNVKVTPQGEVSLVDFGLAKVIEGNRETTPGARAMTPGYSPPEQYGTARTDPRTDIYSLGATLYEALTGAVPEDGLGRAMEQTRLSPLRKRNPSVSRRLASVIEKALAVQPEDRFQSAEQFKRALINSIRGSTRRRVAGGGLSVTPPPMGEAIAEDSAGPLEPAVEPDNGAPFPVSEEIAEPPIAPAEPSPRLRWAPLMMVVILGIFIGGGSGLFFFFPNLSFQALSLVFPGAADLSRSPILESPIAALTASPRPAETESIAVVLPSATMTPSPPPRATATPQLSPSPEEQTRPAVATAVPSVSPTLQPTPVGSGRGQIAFASDRTGLPQIWLAEVDGKVLKRITDMPDGACQPAWAPDGARLVFISPCDRNKEVYRTSSLFIINVDGGEITPLPTILGGDYDPEWSPDGKEIIFTSLRVDNRPQIFVMNLEDNAVERISQEITRDFQPVWSPDGSRIMFVTTRKGPFQIWIMDRDGSNPELFTRSGGQMNVQPAWSPDGQVVMFDRRQTEGDVPTLYAVRFEDTSFNEFRIFENWIPSQEGSFSPDGVWITFESWPDGVNHDVYVMTANGLDRRRITEHPAFDFDPVWRPGSSSP